MPELELTTPRKPYYRLILTRRPPGSKISIIENFKKCISI
jgi:hypothetical protein